MKNVKHTTIILSIIALLIPLSSAAAHRPLWGEQYGPIEIPNLRTSFAVYRDLAPNQIDVYNFEAEAGHELHAGIQVPVVAGLEEYGVTVALFGPGLPEADPLDMPSDHPENLGALVFPSSVSVDFYEPFTQTNYWGRQEIDLTLPAEGTYYLLIWQPDGQSGKYVLDTGRAEVFSPIDIFRFPVWWVRVHIFFGHGTRLALLGALIVIAVVLLFIRKWTQKSVTAKELYKMSDTVRYELPPEGITLLGYIVRRMHKTAWLPPVPVLLSQGQSAKALEHIAIYTVASSTSYGRAYYQPNFDATGDSIAEPDPATGAEVTARLDSRSPHYHISSNVSMPNGDTFQGKEEITGTTVGFRGLGMPAPSRFTFTSGDYTAELTGIITSELALSLFGNTRIRAYGSLNFIDTAGNTGRLELKRDGKLMITISEMVNHYSLTELPIPESA